MHLKIVNSYIIITTLYLSCDFISDCNFISYNCDFISQFKFHFS